MGEKMSANTKSENKGQGRKALMLLISQEAILAA